MTDQEVIAELSRLLASTLSELRARTAQLDAECEQHEKTKVNLHDSRVAYSVETARLETKAKDEALREAQGGA